MLFFGLALRKSHRFRSAYVWEFYIPLVMKRKRRVVFSRANLRGRRPLRPAAVRFNDPIPRSRATIHMPELKFHDLIAQTIAVTTAGLYGDTPLNAVDVGNTQITRIGNRITIKKIGIRFQLLPAATTDDGDVLRIIVLLDKQPNGADPAVLDLLQSANFQAFKAVKTMKRISVLMDKYVAWSADGVDVAGTGLILKRNVFEWYKDVNIDIEYEADDSTIASIGTNAIHVFAISQQASDTVVTYGTRISYVDY